MLKLVSSVLVALLLTSCATSTIDRSSTSYPLVTPDQAAGIERFLVTGARTTEQFRRLTQITRKASSGQPLTEGEVSAVNILLVEYRRQQALEEERRDEEEKKKVALAKKEQEAADRRKEKVEVDRRGQYLSDYNGIWSPEQAQQFIARYSGKNDPDNLASTAMKKGYSAGIQHAQECIDRANRMIAAQKEIGSTVGVVSMTALYEAGASLRRCKKQLTQYKTEAARLGY